MAEFETASTERPILRAAEAFPLIGVITRLESLHRFLPVLEGCGHAIAVKMRTRKMMRPTPMRA
jgi:hypothetical protein